MRSTVAKTERNRNAKSRVRTLEKKFRAQVTAGEKEAAAATMSLVFSALDKASKGGSLHWATVNRKKARIAKVAASAK